MKYPALIVCSVLLGTQSVFSQHCVQGYVVDQNDHPIPFATVSTLPGKGSFCDESGHFEICALPEGSGKLIGQALGFFNDTVDLKAQDSNITITLKSKEFILPEAEIVHKQSIQEKSIVSTITAGQEEINRLNPQNVSEVLQTKTGFTNRSGYQTPLTLRGMSGKQLLVLRNGIRRFSSYPAGYMSHTINVYDLERIEVEKGASSVVYGAGAMAGVINLIDRSLFEQEGFRATLTTGYSTVNNEKNILAWSHWSKDKLAVKAGIRYRKADDFKYAGGSVAENSFYTDKDILLSAGYKFSGKQNIVFTADIHEGGPWGKAVGFNGSKYMRVQTRNELSYNYALKYTYTPGHIFRNIEWDAFYSDEKRELVKNYYTAANYMLSYVETTKFSDYYYGSRLSGNLRATGQYTIRTGGEFYSFHISTPTDAINYIDGLSFQNRVSHNARSFISGIFIENNITVNDKTKLIAGIRYDYASVFEGDVYSHTQDGEKNSKKQALSGNIGTSFRVGNYSRMKINLARSFRMPETTELYADSYTSNGILYSNPDLEPEYCYSIDLSYNYSPSFVRIEVSPFLWFMNNMISKEEFRGIPGTNYQYVNIGKARLWGGEITVEAPFHKVFSAEDQLDIAVGMAYLNGTDVTDNQEYLGKGTPLDYVPPFNLKLTISYAFPLSRLAACTVDLRTIYYAEQTRLGKDPYATPAYLLLGCTIGVDFPTLKTLPSFNLSINNLMNREYYSYYSYIPGEGIDFRLFLTFHIN